MRKFLFCFVGIDGSGKTTQAKALVNALEERGTKSRYIYNRFTPILSRPFMSIGGLLFFRGRRKFQNYDGYASTRGRVFKNRPLSIAYQFFLLFDYCLQTLARLSLPLIRGQSIICDRYIYDTAIDIAIDLDYSQARLRVTLDKLLRCFPRPDLIFLVDVPEEIAYQRKDDIPTMGFLKERRQLYLDIAKEYEMVILDGSQDTTELQSIIQTKLGEVMNWSGCL